MNELKRDLYRELMRRLCEKCEIQEYRNENGELRKGYAGDTTLTIKASELADIVNSVCDQLGIAFGVNAVARHLINNNTHANLVIDGKKYVMKVERLIEYR